MSKILLDTNAYSHFLLGDKRVLESLAGADLVYISIFVLGELYYGYLLGNKEKENRQKLNTFLDKPSVFLLNATQETSEFFAIIKKQLKENGTPIPLNDVWIAAHTMEMGAELITYDKHFQYVPGLRIWKELL
ncbi:MAG: type II toxin-antitoxin system VapC family toxin [Lewinellaceae bacterium]|nr:type II toxin-antitoxin system VapC family toxin [Phaeodactylibacter sp.]MCB9346604.1 type II toxin-antitoxin system VapC family toxin [Lewinellaceae bacterium]